MLPDNKRKEALSRAYIQAVAAKAGLSLEWVHNDFGVDGVLREIESRGKKFRDSGRVLDFQAKATSRWEFEGTEVKVQLDVDNYNDMIERDAASGVSGLVVFVLCLPENEAEWLDLTPEQLVLRECCYWYRPYPEAAPSSNKYSVTIRIPAGQVLEPEALATLIVNP